MWKLQGIYRLLATLASGARKKLECGAARPSIRMTFASRLLLVYIPNEIANHTGDKLGPQRTFGVAGCYSS
jgi:hypothetical protein